MPSCRHRPIALVTAFLVLLFGLPAVAQSGGELPNRTYSADQQYAVITAPLGPGAKHNQPGVVNGYLMLAGNGHFEMWDISDPFAPIQLSTFDSQFNEGEAESHQVSFSKKDDRYRAVTISGRGVDLWDVTDPENPTHLTHVMIEGVDYGDNSEAVWGVFWQGDYIYVGGTNTGLHIVDATDPANATVINRLPTSDFGGVSAGPLWAVGNLLVITTPENHAGIATLDISDPANPAVLDFVVPQEESYIGAFYGDSAYLLTPFRTYDVTTDPANITLEGSDETDPTEYMTFADGLLFLGALRPEPGVFKIDISDPNDLNILGKVQGRNDFEDFVLNFFSDDQFSLPVGNLLILSDDEVNVGSAIAVHDTRKDTTPPEVAYVNPKDGATSQAPTSRIGLSFTDQIDLRSVDTASVIVRPVGGGDPLTGTWGHGQTVITFWPDQPLAENTTYEVLLPAGGVTDLVGNGLPSEFRSVFSTGENVAMIPCEVTELQPTEANTAYTYEAAEVPGAQYEWDFAGQTISSGTPEAQFAWQNAGRHVVGLTVETAEGTRSCTATHVVHNPLPEFAGRTSGSIAVDEERGVAWTVNPDADSVAVVPLEGGATRELPLTCDEPTSVAVSSEGKAWVTCRQSDAVLVVGASGEVIANVALGWGAAPSSVLLSEDSALAWVALDGPGDVVEVDGGTFMLRERTALGPDASGLRVQSGGMGLTPDGKLLVSRFMSSSGSAEVFVLDPTPMTIEETIVLAESPGPDAPDGGRGLPNYLGAPAPSPDGTRVRIPSKKDNVARGLARDGEPLNTTNTVRTIVSALSWPAGTEDLEQRVDLDDHSMARAVAFSPLGDLFFIASMGTNQIDVYDAYTHRRVTGVSTGLAPVGLAVTENGRLLVDNFLSRSVSVYDVSGLLNGTDSSIRLIEEVSTVNEEPLDPNVLLGKQLFYNADNPQMSQDGYIACASCHLDGGEDGINWDFTDRGEGIRNTIDLRGKSGTGHGRIHWTGNFDEVHDFENDIRSAFGGSGLMSNEAFSQGTRSDPLGEPKAGQSAQLDALAAYVSTLDTFPRSPWLTDDGEFSPEAEAGYQIFLTLDCLNCHSGQPLTDSTEGLRHDVGTLRPESGQRIGGELDGIDTPTLRGLWASAPYFHDGSALTLRETLEVEGHGNAQSLSADGKDQLVAFLLSLDNQELETGPRDPMDQAEFDFRPGPPDFYEDPPQNDGDQVGGGGDGCGCNIRSPGDNSSEWPVWPLFVIGLIGLGTRRKR